MHISDEDDVSWILTPDLITEILSWLPVKILGRFRCVCKYWKLLIFEPTFAKLHHQRSPKHTHTLLTLFGVVNDSETWVVAPHSVRRLLEHPSSPIKEEECWRFKDETYYAIGCVNGLVCLIDYESQEDGKRKICIRFWNPTLRLRSQKSPILYETPSDLCVHLGFGYDDSGDIYKVVTVFWDHTEEKWEVRVHCMGDNCWRKILTYPDCSTLLGTLVGSFLNGSVNWLALTNLNCPDYELEDVIMDQLVIFSFDLRNETYEFMSLPDGFGEKPPDEPALDVLRDCLCLSYDHMKTHFVLWEMREFGVHESWTKIVNVSYVQLHFFDLMSEWLLFPVSLSGDLLLLAIKETCDGVILCNPIDGKVQHIELPNCKIMYAEEHMQSLVLPRPLPH